MIEIPALILFGMFAGAAGTLVGIGGGPVLVPFLMVFYKMAPTEAVATSLFVIFFNVLSGSFAYFRQNRIDIISGTKFGIATIPGAILGGYLIIYIPVALFDGFFGVLILLLSIFLVADVLKTNILGRPKVNPQPPEKSLEGFWTFIKYQKRDITDSEGKKFIYYVDEVLGCKLSALIGFVAPILGTGGGILHVPMMLKILKFPIHIATATAHYQLLICVLFALLPYLHLGTVDYSTGFPLGIGSLIGASFGAVWSRKLGEKYLILALAALLFVLSIRLLILN